MTTFKALSVALSLAFAAGSFAAEHELDQLDTSLVGVDVSAVQESQDFETIFVKQDKDFPEQVAAMISAEAKAWEEHSKKLDKSWWNQGIDYCRSYRYGYRQSYYNGYRYSQRHGHGYQYGSSCNDSRAAYVYGYGRAYNNFGSYYGQSGGSWNSSYSGFQGGYQNSYRSGYDAGQGNWSN